MTGNSKTSANYRDVVDDLYAGTIDDAAWGRALIGIADMVRASATLLLAFNPSSGALLREENHRLDPSTLEDYRDYWTFHDCRREYFMATPVGCPGTERTLSIPDWRRSPILNEFLLPADAPHFMPAWVRKSGTLAVTLSLQGTLKRGAFDTRDIENFRRILPHVGRALEIRDRLEAAQLRANTLASCLHRVPCGVIVLSIHGKIIEVNAAAERVLRTEKEICGTLDRTLVINKLTGASLWRWLHRSTKEGVQEHLIRVERGPGRWPITVMVTAMPRMPVPWSAGEQGCLLFLFDPEHRVTPHSVVLMEEMGISAREAEIAVLLFMGVGLTEVAQRLLISVHTARTHLKSIYAKTGIRSQNELIRRVATGPTTYASQAPLSRKISN
jgi:DNA-binding CsgD family transcriptional regulator/PAS domain-containing protein